MWPLTLVPHREVSAAQTFRVGDITVAVTPLPLACCAVEAASAIDLLTPASADAAPITAHLLLVAGTITTAQLPLVQQAWQSLPSPKASVAFGACTISGGPYWDSYAVVPGLTAEFQPCVHVPGCPPHPHSLLQAIAQACELAS